MDLKIDPNLTLVELQLTLFMAAITALVELAKTTDKDHIKLRALTEVARLCNPQKTTPSKPTLTPRRGGSPDSSPTPPPTPHGTRSANDGPHAPATSHATSSPDAPIPVVRAPGSEGKEPPLPRATGIGSAKPVSPAPTENLPLESLLPLNRQQRRFFARMEANERKRETRRAA